jgi:hypothetical protein
MLTYFELFSYGKELSCWVPAWPFRDLKSLACKGVRVRAPPRAPAFFRGKTGIFDEGARTFGFVEKRQDAAVDAAKALARQRKIWAMQALAAGISFVGETARHNRPPLESTGGGFVWLWVLPIATPADNSPARMPPCGRQASAKSKGRPMRPRECADWRWHRRGNGWSP